MENRSQAAEGEPGPVPAAESPNVHRVSVDGKQVYLLGTAHISANSADEAERLIGEIKPDSVCVELCATRHQSLTSGQAWQEMDIIQVIRRKQATMLLAHLILAAFQRRLGDRLGIRPGAEMVRAMEAAQREGAELVLADREIQVTLLRTWRTLGWWDKLKLITQLTLTLVMSPELDAEEIEKLKDQDVLSQVMETFATAFPRAKGTLIDERDTFLAEKIRAAPGKTVVAVVGAGHLHGIREKLAAGGEPVALEPLLHVPPRGKTLLVVEWGVPLLVLGLIGYGFFGASAAVSWHMVQIWVLANGVLAALGALLALAHPLTILASFLAAPLTSLNPMIAAGWVAGLCEAVLKKPRVRDFESLPGDMVSLGGFWRNGITHILLVVALANLGSTLGTLFAIPLMSSLLN